MVDDIVLNFDDLRATPRWRLAELSARTQVLFFTHHRHIIDLAKACLLGDVVFVHERPGARGQVIIPTLEDIPAAGPAGRSSHEMAQ